MTTTILFAYHSVFFKDLYNVMFMLYLLWNTNAKIRVSMAYFIIVSDSWFLL